MIQKVLKNAKSNVVLFASVLALSSLVLTGCGSGGGGGSDSYDTPATTETAPINGAATDVLVGADTVAAWIASGQVGAAASFDRKVVVLDYGSYPTAEALGVDRIKGSCRVDIGDLRSQRVDGIAEAYPMVATGAQIDSVIQRLGIDENTTIVFTTKEGNPGYFTTRAYWMFRYWGFSRDNLKVLDGGNTAFAAAYPELMTTDVPIPTASTFSVQKLAGLNDDLRASVGEMIEIVKVLPGSTTNMVFDARGATNYNGEGVTPGYVPPAGDGVVVVDGHPAGGEFIGQGGLYVDTYKGGKFKSAADILAIFEATTTFSADKKATVYCTSGYSATPLFFALDALLGVDVQLYDGSWSQFGKYSDFTAAGGELPPGSAWAIDEYLEVYNYNDDIASPLTIETLDAASAVAPQAAPFTGDVPADNSDVVQSQVEAADADYAAGMGGIDMDAPVLTKTFNDNVMIDYDTLEGWMDAGLVNAASGEKVVILDVTSELAYGTAHIPGAQLWNYVGQAIVRTEGPAPAVNMVLDGASMDARIQAAGIDANTTVVITSSATATYFPSRAYFLFRYWGFDKARIKVLNGYNAAWPTPDLTDDAPTVTASTLSVADLNSGVQLDTRVALAELMDAARDNRGTAIDFRGDKAATAGTPGVFGASGDYGVFEGRLNNGTFFSWQNFNTDYAGGNLVYKSKAEIAAEMLAAGIDVSAFSSDGSYSNPVYSYCRTGYIASTGFFVMDAIMGLDVMTYDGSWSQWGKMSADTAKGGELADSAWATDSSEYMQIINYNVDHTAALEALNADAAALDLLPSDTAANQIENADFEYQILTNQDDAPVVAPPTAGGGATVGC